LEPQDSQSARWFADEVLPHEPQLRAWLQARFLSASDVDDVVQESYARLWRARATGAIACPRAFVFVTARNLALNRLRHERVERPRDAAEVDSLNVPDERTSIPESIAHAEDLQLLMRAIQALPERCRQILTLRKIYGLSQREVADRLGIAESTVETQGTIGLRRCSEYFRRHGYLARAPR
jgi:RNA polymerase sigma-70 factor (ECF subfamily)